MSQDQSHESKIFLINTSRNKQVHKVFTQSLFNLDNCELFRSGIPSKPMFNLVQTVYFITLFDFFLLQWRFSCLALVIPVRVPHPLSNDTTYFHAAGNCFHFQPRLYDLNRIDVTKVCFQVDFVYFYFWGASVVSLLSNISAKPLSIISKCKTQQHS